MAQLNPDRGCLGHARKSKVQYGRDDTNLRNGYLKTMRDLRLYCLNNYDAKNDIIISFFLLRQSTLLEHDRNVFQHPTTSLD